MRGQDEPPVEQGLSDDGDVAGFLAGRPGSATSLSVALSGPSSATSWSPMAGSIVRTMTRVSPEVGRILLVLGLLIAGVGLLAILGLRIPIGQLPGDIRIEGEHGTILIPIATSLIISVLLTVLLTIFARR
jgi:hypothetical protein